MTAAVVVLVGAVIVSVIAPYWLARLEASRLEPAAVLSCWWSAIAGVLVSILAATALLLLPDRAGAGPSGRLGDLCVAALSHARKSGLEGILTLVLTGVVGFALLRLVRVGRMSVQRRRHVRSHLGVLIMTGRVESNTVWLPHPVPLAFSIVGRQPVVVATSGLRDALSVESLAAVLAHERAHLSGRHHVQVAVADALAVAVPGLPLFRGASVAVRRLVEFAADAAAARQHGPAAVASALRVVGDQAVPPGALGMSGSDRDARLLRLAEPERPARGASESVARAFSVGVTGLLSAVTGGALAATVTVLACF